MFSVSNYEGKLPANLTHLRIHLTMIEQRINGEEAEMGVWKSCLLFNSNTELKQNGSLEATSFPGSEDQKALNMWKSLHMSMQLGSDELFPWLVFLLQKPEVIKKNCLHFSVCACHPGGVSILPLRLRALRSDSLLWGGGGGPCRKGGGAP